MNKFFICYVFSIITLIKSQILPDAEVTLIPASGSNVTGTLTIERTGNGITISGTLEGLFPGKHGFHIHQSPDISKDCASAGGHFNPFGNNHGGPDNEERHVGDLGNIEARDNGTTDVYIFDNLVSLDPQSKAYIGNLSIVIHAGEDDLGLGGTQDSLTTGNAGGRIACGQIVTRESRKNAQVDLIRMSLPGVKGNTATVSMVPGIDQINGNLIIKASEGGILISGTIFGLSPGYHGFHIHEKGELGNMCKDAGGHFNPFMKAHGSPINQERHVGDLGNILVDGKGIAQINIFDDHASLNPLSPAYIGGLSFVVHAGSDDLGTGGNEGSLRTGNAGGRSGCGYISVIEEKSVEEENFALALANVMKSKDSLRAVVNITPGGRYSVRGRLEFYQMDDDVAITGRIEGLTPGLHGFHIHQFGSIDNDCVAAGGHFNPYERTHGSPSQFGRHAGDLGNIFADEKGIASVIIRDNHISLSSGSVTSIYNRTIVIHADPDDLGKGRNEGSLKTGNAGKRVGCGVITRNNPYPAQTPTITAPQQIQKRLGVFEEDSVKAESTMKDVGFKNLKAVVKIVPGSSNAVQGELILNEQFGAIRIQGRIMGLTPGFHGFHVHQLGNLSNNCKAAGGHFNPFEKNHGHPDDIERHVGDLGNIFADDAGIATINIVDKETSLDKLDMAYIGGRAFVIHADSDDFGKGGNEGSLKTGNAGSRVACGLVEIQEETGDSKKSFSEKVAVPLSFEASNIKAAAEFVPGASRGIGGVIELTQVDGGVFLKGRITGLSEGFHGFHIHEKGDLGKSCTNAGGHFNPFKKSHGSPSSENRHAGDLGNIRANDKGVAAVDIFDNQISLHTEAPNYVGERAFVVHEGPDDLGEGGDEESLRTGNAGARAGCALIVLGPPKQMPAEERREDFQASEDIRKDFVIGNNFQGTFNEEVDEFGIPVNFEKEYGTGEPEIVFPELKNPVLASRPFQNKPSQSNVRKQQDFAVHIQTNQYDTRRDRHPNKNAQPSQYKEIPVHSAHSQVSKAVILNRPESRNSHTQDHIISSQDHQHFKNQHHNGDRTRSEHRQHQLRSPARHSSQSQHESHTQSNQHTSIFPQRHSPQHHHEDRVQPQHIQRHSNIPQRNSQSNQRHRGHGEQKNNVQHHIIRVPIFQQIPHRPVNKELIPSRPTNVKNIHNVPVQSHPSFSIREPISQKRIPVSQPLVNIPSQSVHHIEPHSVHREGARESRPKSAKKHNIPSKVAVGFQHQSFASSPVVSSPVKHRTPAISMRAIAEFIPGASEHVTGNLILEQEELGVHIQGMIYGLSPGLHGFHVHSSGDLSDACAAAGGHFNPFDKMHGDPTSSERHAGDLGNIYADKTGAARVDILDGHISLHPRTKNYIGGRAFVVHARADDLGAGRNAESKRTGNAGARLGCATIIKQ